MTSARASVRIWSEEILIPTYPVGQPDRNPMFLEKRVYQGSSGAVYPLPVIDWIGDEKHDQPWQAVFLENEYLRIMVLPQLGGRVQMALDKTNDYHFVYHNRVIKPALVGLAGPWISGGIEFNWPQHHRPSTYDTVDYALEQHQDGAATIWISEYERMTRTRCLVGFRLEPACAQLQISARLINRTPLPQSFLWWANPAVHVGEHYQSIFPPDVHAVMDHGKRDVSRFPIATGTYYKMDYSAGVDISRYTNIPVPTSYMAYASKYDFVGGYDHGRQAGLLHVANHHLSPGKKQWTWGCGEFGQAWDRNLTDDDGPYFELMTGVFTDNQPDFTWLMPGETKTFKQVFMPYKGLGQVHQATAEALLHLSRAGAEARVAVYVSRPRPGLTLRLMGAGAVLWEALADLGPEAHFETRVPIADPALPDTELRLEVRRDDGLLLLAWSPEPEEIKPMPEPAKPAQPPQAIKTNEELYLCGLHLEQYRHATCDPVPYYEEALRRDPQDSRCLNALGRLRLRRGELAAAEQHLRAAVASLTRFNPNPYDGEPHYNLGLALLWQDRIDEAYAAFYKAGWSAAWKSPAALQIARIEARRGRFHQWGDAMAQSYGAYHEEMNALSYAMMRHGSQARVPFGATRPDPLNLALHYETLLGLEAGDELRGHDRHDPQVTQRLLANPWPCLEVAFDYAAAGLYTDAIDLLRRHLAATPGPHSPLIHYLRGDCAARMGDATAARDYRQQAAAAPADYCFPNQIEAMLILQRAIEAEPTDARAPYYLGNFLYDKRRYDEAITMWERATRLDPAFPTAWRNLGLAYFNKRGDSPRALTAFERAFSLDPTDARVLFELDQLRRKLNHAPAARLGQLQAHPALVARRDDLALEQITLLNQLGRHDDALAQMRARNFHPWEGGEGKVTGQYVVCLLAQAKAALLRGAAEEALVFLDRATHYPTNLGEGKLHGAQENHLHYFTGLACLQLGRTGEARRWFERASIGLADPTSPMFYNDQPPDMIFYQGLALRRLGNADGARARFNKLVDYGERHLFDQPTIDYFAVSLPDFLVFDDDLALRNQLHCHYMLGLGHLGLNACDKARAALEWVCAHDVNHLGASHALELMEHTEWL